MGGGRNSSFGTPPGAHLSKSWPTRPSASTWSSCLPVGNASSSAFRSSSHGARAGTYKPSSSILPRMLCARTALSWRVGNCSRFVYACRSLARAVMKGPTPEVIWVFSSAQNAGFHLVTRSHHASIHTLDEEQQEREAYHRLLHSFGCGYEDDEIPPLTRSPRRRPRAIVMLRRVALLLAAGLAVPTGVLDQLSPVGRPRVHTR